MRRAIGHATLGRLPGTWSTIALTAVSGISESFGLAMFVPLIERMGTPGGSSSVPGRLKSVFDTLGLGAEVEILPLLVLLTGLLVTSFALAYMRDSRLTRAKYRFAAEMRDTMTESLLRSAWPHLSRQPAGDIVNQALVEALRAGNALSYQVLIIGTLVQILLYAAVSALLSWQMLLVTAGLSALIGIALRPLVRRSRVLGEASSAANRGYSFHFVDYLRGIRLIRVTASESEAIGRIKQHNHHAARVNADAEVNTQLTYFFTQAMPVAIFAIVLGLGALNFGVSGAVLLTFFLVMSRLAPRLSQLLQHYQGYLNTEAGLVAVDRTIAEARARAEDTSGEERLVFRGLKHGITLENVVLRFSPDDPPALDGVSLDIGRNSLVALIGGSGAGKTTIIDVLAALRRPDSGRVLVDHEALQSYDLISWRRRIGYVTQDTVVFNDTLRNNLAFASPGSTEEKLIQALKTAHLGELLASLPQGLDTPLEEGGVRLSGGQKQRLALARALVGDPDILLLDEATSALDNESERLVQDAIEAIAHRMTIVVVAHRLSTVRRADVIYVLEKGRVIEHGAYDDLLASKGRFAELHALQFS